MPPTVCPLNCSSYFFEIAVIKPRESFQVFFFSPRSSSTRSGLVIELGLKQFCKETIRYYTFLYRQWAALSCHLECLVSSYLLLSLVYSEFLLRPTVQGGRLSALITLFVSLTSKHVLNSLI